MHCIHNWLADSTHNIRVLLVGVGGTGSYIATELAQLSFALKEMDRMPLEIHIVDPDDVESHNVGRQKFYPCDIGLNKSVVLASRINRVFQTDIEAYPDFLSKQLMSEIEPHIVISAVDNVKTRKLIHNHYKFQKKQKLNYKSMFYWFDAGNNEKSGQVIMSSYGENPLPSIVDLYPDMKDDKNRKSCSMAESLFSQGFMINKMTSYVLMEMLSSLLLDFCINYSQVYFDLDNMNFKTNKI